MKRLNPETGKPFVRGDTRADGFLFLHYENITAKKTGFFYESWVSPLVFNKQTVNKNNLSLSLHRRKAITPNGRATLLLNSAKTRCKNRKVGVVSVTKSWVENKIVNGICELTGLPFDLEPTDNYRNNPYAPSLDRIDNKNPDYSVTNTRLVLVAVNTALNEFGLDTMLPIFERLVHPPMR